MKSRGVLENYKLHTPQKGIILYLYFHINLIISNRMNTMPQGLHSRQKIKSLRNRFFMRADKNIKADRLTNYWRAYVAVKMNGQMHKDFAHALNTKPHNIWRWIETVEKSIKQPLIVPSDEAVLEKQHIYFSRSRGKCGTGEATTEATMLRNWDIFMRREIQKPKSSVKDIQTVYPHLHKTRIQQIVKDIQYIIGPFKDTDMLKGNKALKEHLGLRTPDIDEWADSVARLSPSPTTLCLEE